MKQSKVEIYLILLVSLLINTSALASISMDQYDPVTQMAVGTFIYHNKTEEPMLITSNKNGLFTFQNIYSNDGKGVYFNGVSCVENNCIINGAYETDIGFNSRRPFFQFSNNHGKSWSTVKKIADLPDIQDGITPFLSCNENVCAAAGWYRKFNEATYPLMLISRDRGLNWNFVKDIPQLPSSTGGDFSAITCMESYCIAGGTYFTDINEDHRQNIMLLSSRDSGMTWTMVQDDFGLAGMRTASLYAIKCIKKTCIAAGTYTTDYKYTKLFILLSYDEGLSWKTIKNFPELEHVNYLFVEDIAYSNDNIVLVGDYEKDLEEGKESGSVHGSLLLVSKDQGKTWSLKPIADANNHTPGWLKSIYCSHHTCIAAGKAYYFFDDGFRAGLSLLISKDDGETWKLITSVTGTIEKPDIFKIDCQGNHCVAFGSYPDNSEHYHDAILESNDLGSAWSLAQKVQQFPDNVYDIKFTGIAN